MPLEIRGAHFLIRSAQLVRGTRLEYRPWIASRRTVPDDGRYLHHFRHCVHRDFV